MRKLHYLNTLLACVLILGLSSSGVRAESGIIIALFPMEDRGSNLKPQVLINLMDYLAARLTEGGYQVVPPSQIRNRLRNQRKESLKGCYDQSCQIELGRELAAQKSLSTKILRIGDTCQVTAVLYDLRRSTTDTAATNEAKCEVNALLRAVKAIAINLCKPLKEAEKQADANLASFERLRRNVEHEQAERNRIEEAWAFVAKTARDERLKQERRVEALETFLGTFKKENPYLKEAQKLLKILKPSFLNIASDPPGASVSIDNQVIGAAPIQNHQLQSGMVHIVASLPGYQPAGQKAQLLPGQTLQVKLKLEKNPGGTLLVKTVPRGAQVMIDGSQAGKSPLKRVMNVGSYEVSALMDGYEADDHQVQLHMGQSTEVTIKLERVKPIHPYTLWGHVAVWGGVALGAGGGIACMLLSMDAGDSYEKTGNPDDKDASRLYSGLMWTGYAVGALTIGGGIALWLLKPDDAQNATATSAMALPSPDGRGAVFSLAGRF